MARGCSVDSSTTTASRYGWNYDDALSSIRPSGWPPFIFLGETTSRNLPAQMNKRNLEVCSSPEVQFKARRGITVALSCDPAFTVYFEFLRDIY
ncbi:hypothetical protein Mapa_009973 [Marchantia paleacea]|nr:hypothetical protein Mapa_009973 [Marchantia paleacea]